MKTTVKAMLELFTGSTHKNIGYNYSQSEVGIRHPDGPVGLMVRDQGQLDAYSGRARTIWTLDGLVLTLSKIWGVVSDKIVLKSQDISSLKINDKIFNPALFKGQELIMVTSPVPDNMGFISSDLQIDPNTGRIISGFIPYKRLFQPTRMFLDDPETEIYPSKEVRKYNQWLKEFK